MQSNTAKRARKLAKPAWDNDEGRSQSDFGDLLDEEGYLNKTIDWTFDYHYRGKGQWFRNKDTVEVPNVIGQGVNADNKHLAADGNYNASGDIDMITVKQVED
tara:strand:- start:2211 stop:2519 length:309 start_codon:yes stop_codon:yes gene_type:complete